jgi:hypothetical protein
MGSVPWSWKSWITHEQRNRCAYTIYLLDTAYVLYYNVPPEIKPHEMTLPLPADDAAWEAEDGATCAGALRVSGPGAEGAADLGVTTNGTQLRFLDAITRFMSPEPSFPPLCTNVYSKFIIIHALHVQLWFHHMHAAQPEAGWMRYWLGSHAACDGFFDASSIDTLSRAFGKWMDVWYRDSLTQYPDPASRVGFSRNGTQYYHLAMLYLCYVDRRQAGYFEAGDENNVKLTLAMLQHGRNAVLDPSALQYGGDAEAPEIDESYGVDDLTYDMKLLFKPIDGRE